jgi:hypothetical protein
MRRGQVHSAIPDDRRGLLLTIVGYASAPGQMQRADIGLVDLPESCIAIASIGLRKQNPVIVVLSCPQQIIRGRCVQGLASADCGLDHSAEASRKCQKGYADF